MSLLKAIGGASGSVAPKLDSSEVFSTYTYNGTGATQTINNGIDLAGQGGMVWFKNRGVAVNNGLVDTVRGGTKYIYSDATNAEQTASNVISSFNSNGFSMSNSYSLTNANTNTYASWTFRKAPKFFDIVTYTGDGVAGRQIPHNLGCEVGMIVVKCTSAAQGWAGYAVALGNTKDIQINTTGAASIEPTMWNNTTPSASV